MRAAKIANFSDMKLDNQIQELVARQFANNPIYTLNFTAANLQQKVDLPQGFNRFMIVFKDANIDVWCQGASPGVLPTGQNYKQAIFKATGPGNVSIMMWMDRDVQKGSGF